MENAATGRGTASRQRKDGIWYRAIRIEGTGKRKYLYAKTKAELDKKYKEFTKQLAGGTYREIKKQTVEDYMLDWLTTYKRIELKPKSYDTHLIPIEPVIPSAFLIPHNRHGVNFVGMSP